MSTSDPQNRKPAPSRLCLLSDVHLQPAGTKVRFLGCVNAYHIASGTLILRAEYPAGVVTADSTVLAGIDHVLNEVNHELLQTGAWVNVIGYVRAGEGDAPRVEVLMIWSAGAVKVEDYYSAARSYQRAMD